MTRVTSTTTKNARHKSIKVKVPRLNAPRLSSKLLTHVTASSKPNFSNDSMETSQIRELSQAIENASEWNSLLLTARAERGPQWDVGTQQFLVDYGSKLYYDPTDLQQAVRQKQKQEDHAKGIDKKPERGAPPPPYPRDSGHPPPMGMMPSHGGRYPPQMDRGPPGGGFPPQQQPNYGGPPHARGMPPPMNGMSMGMPPDGQFYPNGQGGMGGGSPGMNMPMMEPVTPEMMRRRSTRGYNEFGEERFPMR